MIQKIEEIYIPKNVSDIYNYYIVEPLHPDYTGFMQDVKQHGYKTIDIYRFLKAINKGAL